LGGPLVTVALGPVMLFAQTGARALLHNEHAAAGFAGLGGVASCF
jgi:hypothetical protein